MLALTLPTLEDRRARYLTFFSTYLYQGLVAGFSLTALANHYAAIGISAGEVGLHFALAGLPWTLQPVLWGPLVDRSARARMGRRRVWSVAALLAAQCVLAGLLLVPGADALTPVGLVFLGHSLFASLVDTACDRLIMDHVPEAELGRMSACTRVGFVVGTSLSAALFSWSLERYGFRPSALLLIALSSAAALAPLLVRERTGDALISFAVRPTDGSDRKPVPFRRFMKRLVLGLRRPTALRLLALCFGIDAALSLFEVRFSVDLVQGQGWDAGELSRLQAGLALASGTLGALAIGVWSDRAGPLPALTALCVGSAAAFAVSAALIGAGWLGASGPAILMLTNALPGLLIVALVPALMTASRGAGAATQFEVYMATMNLGSVAGGAASGALAPALPLAAAALLVAAVFAASAALVRRPNLIFAGDRRRLPR